MAKQPTSGQNNTADNLQTWILRVFIHCEGCKKKVFKVLQSIDGVYKTVIDAKEHKATVTGTVSGETLVQKLLKSGKHAEILPESFKASPKEADNDAGNQKKKKKQGNNKKGEVMVLDDVEHVKEEKTESEDVAIDGNDAENDETKGEPEDNDNKSDTKDNEDAKDNGGGGGKKKKNKKKKKGEKDENNAPTKGDIDDLPTDALADDNEVKEELKAKNVEPSMEQLNIGPQMVYAAPPYDMTPYYNNNYTPYYPTPGYGVSYNTSYPGAESSYYTPPVYGYAQSHPAGYYPPPPPRSYYPRSAFDDDVEGDAKGYCAIM